ncbi:MAG: SprB repeat-containing protein [Bacteroidota bacterium]
MYIYKHHNRFLLKRLLTPTLLVALLSLPLPSLWAQANIRVTIDGGTVSTTCSDPGGVPQARWRVNVEGTGWVTYPEDGPCFVDPPNVQFDQIFGCRDEAPGMMTICFEAFEDDGNACVLNQQCLESICEDYPLPASGTADVYNLALPPGGSSEGNLDFTIETIGDYRGGQNDDMCGATHLGVLNPGGTLGDASLSNYNNYCTDGAGEPNPANEGSGWGNNHSVWFSFTTSDDPSAVISFVATSDPQNLGEPMGIQLALYQSDDGTCTGNFSMVASRWNNATLDEWLLARCLAPNTTYYLLVDGIFPPPITEGLFGLEMTDELVEYAPDSICHATDLGTVPAGGQLSSGADQSNACATSVDDPMVQNFSTEQTVWYSFVAPASRHVFVDVISSLKWPAGLDPIDAQIAAFSSSTGACDGLLTEVGSRYTAGLFNESLELTCLEPGNTYYVMIDGGPDDLGGVFEMIIRDAGYDPILSTLDTTICFGESITVGGVIYDSAGSINENIVTAAGCDSLVTGTLTIRPEVSTMLDTAVCFGETIMVGTSTYISTGNYTEVLTDQNGCDSTVFTNFLVADELQATTVQTIEATAYQVADGAATVNVNGGLPNYTYLWSDGQTTATAVNLTGGETYCVSVTDNIGCMVEACVLVLFPSNILTSLEDYLLTCPGDSDGALNLSVSNGVVPYNYAWSNDDNSLNGSGMIALEGGTGIVNGLPAGTYTFTITDAFGLKVANGAVLDPPAIVTTIDTTLCFGESLLVGGVNYATTGLIDEVLNSYLGCDSTVNGIVNVLPLNETILEETLCFGESLMVGNTNYQTSGPIAEVLTGSNGCDSLVNGNLTILAEIVTTLDTTICFGESLSVGTQVFTGTTAFSEVAAAANGCDSTIVGTLIVLPENTTNLNPTLCFGESFTVGTAVYTTSGIYTEVLTDAAGCDSTVLTDLTILPELSLSASINTEALAYLDPSGIAQASATGSSGNFTYLWSNGETTPTASNLQGGMTYCALIKQHDLVELKFRYLTKLLLESFRLQ